MWGDVGVGDVGGGVGGCGGMWGMWGMRGGVGLCGGCGGMCVYVCVYVCVCVCVCVGGGGGVNPAVSIVQRFNCLEVSPKTKLLSYLPYFLILK